MLRIGNKKLSLMIRNFLLYFSIIFFSVLSSVPIKFFSFVSIFPNIASMLIFYFMITAKSNINYFAIFIFGILFDVFNNMPLGTTSLTWLISSKIISFLRIHLYTPNDFIYSFRDYIIFALLNTIIEWSILSIVNRVAFPILNSFIAFIINIAFFAILYKLFRKFDKFYNTDF